MLPAINPDVLPIRERWEPKSKFWIAVRARAAVEIPLAISNDRKYPYRRAPSELYGRLPAELVESIKRTLLDYVASAEDKLKNRRVELAGSKRREELKAFVNLKQLAQQLECNRQFRRSVPVQPGHQAEPEFVPPQI